MPTTEQLIEAFMGLRHQDGAAPEAHFWQLVERFRADLVHQAYLILQSQADAEDVAQDSLCEAFKNLRQLGDPQKLPAWLRQINRNNALDLLRRRSAAREERLKTGELDYIQVVPGTPKSRRMAPPGGEPGRSSQVVDEEMVLRAVESLPQPFREVVILRYMEDLPCAAIAARIGLPEGTVRSRLCRADAMLVGRLGLLQQAGSPGERTAEESRP